MYVNFNANPEGNRVGDCTVRAISKVLGESWEITYIGLAIAGFMLSDMPSANHVWGSYLRRRGFCRHTVEDGGKDGYTVRDFCKDNPEGTFVLALNSHVVAVIDGDYYDTWDSGNEIPNYFWKKCGS